MKLVDLFEKNEMYKKIYEFIAQYEELPAPEEVEVIEDPSKHGYVVKDGVLGFCDKEKKTLWFRNFPPDLVTYTHEVLHLIDKGEHAHLEEVFSWNLSSLIIHLVENGIKPKKSPLDLYRMTREEFYKRIKKLLDAYGLRCITELFVTVGGIPPYVNPLDLYNQDVCEKEKEVRDDNFVLSAVTELVAGIKYEPLFWEFLEALLS